MEPLSVAASVIAVIGAAKQTYKALAALSSLRHAPQEFLELINEVSELQALLCLVQKATTNTTLSTITSNDQEFIARLIESAREPLDKLNDLITACSRNTNADAAERGARTSVSKTTWLKSRKSVETIRQRFLRAHRNINTAIAALNNIQQQEDNRLMLNIHELVLNQTTKTEEQRSTVVHELEIYRQFSRALGERLRETASRPDASTPAHSTPSVAAQFDKLNASVHERPGETTCLVSEKEIQIFNKHSGNRDHIQNSASIRASVSKGTCDWSCRCQCHPRNGVETPRWLPQLLGTLFYNYTGTPLLRLRPCNYPDCIQRETVSCQLTYHFPRWMIKKAFFFTSSYRDLSGLSGSWSIGFPRTISASHKAWSCIERLQSNEFLQLLRERSVSGNDMADDDGTSLLIYALKFRSDEIVGLLLDYGANPHLTDPRGISACAYAQSSLLIDRPSHRPLWSAKLNLTIHEPSVTDDLCLTPLHHVVIGIKQADLRQQLDMNRMYIDIPDSFGRSLLHWAVVMGNCAAIEALLDYKASPSCVDRERMTPLHDIYLAPPSAQAQCGRYLLGAGVEVDALDFWGRTPLRIAVGYTSISLDFLTMLINYGADVNLKDLYSQTPVLKSIQGRGEVTQLLLNHGADAAARDGYGNSAVLEAIYRNKPQHLQLLLEHGAETNDYFYLKPGRRARDGQIHLLDFVAWYGSVEIMRVIQDSPTQHYHLSQPLDTVEQFRHFRLANGRKAGAAEHEAFLRLLAKVEFSYEISRHPDYTDDEDHDEEIFVDAHDFLGNENIVTV